MWKKDRLQNCSSDYYYFVFDCLWSRRTPDIHIYKQSGNCNSLWKILLETWVPTVEDCEVERVNVESGVVVVLEDVARRVDVGAGVRGEAEIGEVGDVGAVAHGPRQAKELADALAGLPRRHVVAVVVADVHDPAAVELLPPFRRLCRHAARRMRVVGVAWVRRLAGGGHQKQQKQGKEEQRRVLHDVLPRGRLLIQHLPNAVGTTIISE
jgi:hypothetical protein